MMIKKKKLQDLVKSKPELRIPLWKMQKNWWGYHYSTYPPPGVKLGDFSYTPATNGWIDFFPVFFTTLLTFKSGF